MAAYAAAGVTDTHEAIDRDIADDLLEAGVWIFLRGGPPTTPWHSLPEAIKTVTELGAGIERICVCTDDRDADDLLAFGVDYCVREAVKAGLSPIQAWAVGSLHPATRFHMDGEIGGLGGGRRADLVLMNDDLVPQSTWYGGVHVVEDRKITPVLDAALSNRWRYPDAAYRTVHVPDGLRLTPDLPKPGRITVNAIRTEMPGITVGHERIDLDIGANATWPQIFAEKGLCFVSVIERHGKSAGRVAHGLLSNFNLTRGAVASSVGHDSHNIIVAGVAEEDMRVAVEAIRESHGGVVVVENGAVVAKVDLPIAGLLSDKRVAEVADAVKRLKEAWVAAGCTIPYMGFNLIPLSVIPELRITDMGLVKVPEMALLPLFEPA